MFITISDAAKGKPFSLQEPLTQCSQIAIHRIDMWVGYYNIYEDQTCRWALEGEEESQVLIVESGLYNFTELVEHIAFDGLSITDNRTKGLVEISIPAGVHLWLSEPIRYLLGIDEPGWLTGDYIGDRPPEFTPKRLLIFLKQLSTTGNYENKNQLLQPSQLLHSIPLSAEEFGSFHTIKVDTPQFKQLENTVHELDFDLKVEWNNGVRHKLNNHGEPITLVLSIDK